MNKEIFTDSEEETREFAANFAKTVRRGSIIALRGELGAGKTVFAKGFAKALGIKESVSSPTFTVMQEYRIDGNPQGIKWLYHIDLYRINDVSSALVFGIDEYLEDKDAVLLIEWAERIDEILPGRTINVRITHAGDDRRKIEQDA